MTPYRKWDIIGDYRIRFWQESGLPKASLLRMKFATIDREIIVKRIGRLFEKSTTRLGSVPRLSSISGTASEPAVDQSGSRDSLRRATIAKCLASSPPLRLPR